MSIKLGEHVFDGPFTSTKDLNCESGIFGVIIANQESGSLIDLGETDNIRKCIENHMNKPKWNGLTSEGTICYAVLYTPEFNKQERSHIEQEIRDFFIT